MNTTDDALLTKVVWAYSNENKDVDGPIPAPGNLAISDEDIEGALELLAHWQV